MASALHCELSEVYHLSLGCALCANACLCQRFSPLCSLLQEATIRVMSIVQIAVVQSPL